jgi:hypothetical protein
MRGSGHFFLVRFYNGGSRLNVKRIGKMDVPKSRPMIRRLSLVSRPSIVDPSIAGPLIVGRHVEHSQDKGISFVREFWAELLKFIGREEITQMIHQVLAFDLKASHMGL